MKKGMLPGAVITAVISLMLLIYTLLEVQSFEFLNKDRSHEKAPSAMSRANWPLKVMESLGAYEFLKASKGQYYKKEIYIAKSHHPLSSYKQAFENYMKEMSIPHRQSDKPTKACGILSIFLEEKGFLRVIEIRRKQKPSVPRKSTQKLSVISIVIDDVGRSKRLDKEFLTYPYPLTFAVIPFELYSQSFAKKAKRYGKEVIIHAPMEGSDHVNSLYEINSQITDDQISLLISQYQQDVPNAIGLNNHRGSLATSNPVLMRRFFKYFKKTPLFFLDSRTTKDSIARSVAQSQGVPTLQRDIFLDHRDDVQSIRSQLYKLIRLGRSKRGA
ncbi:MAG TPA: divergent polysaccharide deacetylase family protein, partial [Spirochaetes bacterium]|nr:divergent polysaccharide deacetylase family protein [Spirochaetota bacterium]